MVVPVVRESQTDSPRSAASSAPWCCQCILSFRISFSHDVMTPVATDHSYCSSSVCLLLPEEPLSE